MNAPVLILAGGTGGHIFPALAVAAALRARQVPVLWLGAAGGMETRLVPAAGFELETIAVRGLRGKGVAALWRAPFELMRAVGLALQLLHRVRPRAVVSFGGYVAGPGGLAAWLVGRPLLVHEQNRVPGLTNRVLARLARRVLCGFPDSFGARPCEPAGNPVRREIARLAAPAQRLAGREGPRRLLVLGGSQGARALNLAVPAALSGRAGVEALHQCGQSMRQEVESAYAQAGVQARVEPFIEDMAGAYAWADLAVCRAGALTLAELCAAGLGSVLVPFPAAVDDHQTRNAQFLVERGAARLVPEGEGFAERLRAELSALLADAPGRVRMAEAARALALPDAAERVAEACLAEARP